MINIKYIKFIVEKLKVLQSEYLKEHGEAKCNIICVELDKKSGSPGCHAAWLAIADNDLMVKPYNYGYVARKFIEKAGISNVDIELYWDSQIKPPSGIILSNLFCDSKMFDQETDIFDVSVIIEKWEKLLSNIGDQNGDTL